MSFYVDDNDDFYTSHYQEDNSSKKGLSQDDFICDNCGGTESYMDETTGILTCTECFTQSQNIIANSQMEIDVEEALGLAGRNREGRFISLRRRTGKKFQGKKLEAYDESMALPTILECLRGIQQILKETTKIVCDLAGAEDQQSVFDTVKSMWKAYLLSWLEGAEYYGAIYPEIRLSFRDQFLSSLQRSSLAKNLYFMAGKSLKEEIMGGGIEKSSDDRNIVGEESQGSKEKQTEIILSGYEDDGDDNNSQCSELTTEVEPAMFGKRYQSLTAITQMINQHCKQQTEYIKKNGDAMSRSRAAILIGRKEAALMLEPSMLMVAAILLQSTAHLGVTVIHIRRWISNGSLPLLNSFHLLKAQEQKTLKPISEFFKMKKVPPLNSLERMMSNLHVASGFKPRKIVVRRKKTQRLNITKASKQFKPGRLIIPSHVPMVTARLVSDLGFRQKILNLALALMDLPLVETKMAREEVNESKGKDKLLDPEFWVPPPLNKARPDMLLDRAKILAVIAVACKMIPGWDEDLYFQAPMAQRPIEQNNTSKLSIIGLDAKRVKTERKKHRFVPCTTGHFRFLKNGQGLNDYLDFVEENILNINDVTMPAFVNSLEVTKEDKNAPTLQGKSTLLANNILIAYKKDTTCLSRSRGEKKRKLQNKSLINYQLTERIRGASSFAWQLSPPLGPLIEYMAYKTRTNPMDILNFVGDLDLEIAEKYRIGNGKI